MIQQEMTNADLYQYIVFGVLYGLLLLIVILMSWFGVKPRKRGKYPAVDSLKNHVESLKFLTDTKEGRKVVFDYVKYEANLYGQIDEIVSSLKESKEIDDIEKLISEAQIEPKKWYRKILKKPNLDSKLFEKMNKALIKSIPGLGSVLTTDDKNQ